MTKFAFQIPDNVFENARSKYAMTEKHMIEKYGEEAGKEKWKKYCDRQAETNTLEYKQEKYGWTEDQFKEYNKKRACTLKNFISRWGEQEGQHRWDEYVKRQSETKSESYVIQKYGKDYWVNLCNKKLQTIERFGVYNYSKISQEFFKELDERLNYKYNTECASKNAEHKLELNNHFVYLDYYIPELKLAIEFNGDMWHGNPKIYKPADNCHPMNKNITAGDIQKLDNSRYKHLEKQYGIRTVVVWESDYNEDFDFDKFIKENIY